MTILSTNLLLLVAAASSVVSMIQAGADEHTTTRIVQLEKFFLRSSDPDDEVFSFVVDGMRDYLLEGFQQAYPEGEGRAMATYVGFDVVPLGIINDNDRLYKMEGKLYLREREEDAHSKTHTPTEFDVRALQNELLDAAFDDGRNEGLYLYRLSEGAMIQHQKKESSTKNNWSRVTEILGGDENERTPDDNSKRDNESATSAPAAATVVADLLHLHSTTTTTTATAEAGTAAGIIENERVPDDKIKRGNESATSAPAAATVVADLLHLRSTTTTTTATAEAGTVPGIIVWTMVKINILSLLALVALTLILSQIRRRCAPSSISANKKKMKNESKNNKRTDGDCNNDFEEYCLLVDDQKQLTNNGITISPRRHHQNNKKVIFRCECEDGYPVAPTLQ